MAHRVSDRNLCALPHWQEFREEQGQASAEPGRDEDPAQSHVASTPVIQAMENGAPSRFAYSGAGTP